MSLTSKTQDKDITISEPCYLCSNTTYTRRQGHCRDNPSIYPIECSKCGLVRLSEFAIDDSFYADAHMHDNSPCSPVLMLKQSKEDTARRFAQFKDLILNKHILDFGCGAGGFLLATRDKAASVTGVEPEKRLHPFFKKQRLRVFEDISDIPHDTYFDVITMFHVLEHLPDPLPLLNQIYKLLNGNSRERAKFTPNY